MTTEVVNVYHLKDGWQEDPQYVYIGRPGKGEPGYFGNPYRLVSGNGRGATLFRYERWLTARLIDEPVFREKVAGLRGKTLVCFCKPNSCHGDILAQAAEMLHDIEESNRVAARTMAWYDEAREVYTAQKESAPTQAPDELPDIELLGDGAAYSQFPGEVEEYEDAAS